MEFDITKLKDWKDNYKKLPKNVAKLVDQGEFFEAVKECHTVAMDPGKAVVKLFLIDHYKDKWSEISDRGFAWYLDGFCRGDCEYYLEEENDFEFFQKHDRFFRCEDCDGLRIFDKYIEAHNGNLPKSNSFLYNLNKIIEKVTEEEIQSGNLDKYFAYCDR